MSNSFIGLFSGNAKKTVDGVMAAFSKTIEDLEQVRQDNLNEASIAKELIDAHEARRQAALNEADRALQVSSRLKLIIG